MFFIPKYQRAYAWNSESVEDLIIKNKFCKKKLIIVSDLNSLNLVQNKNFYHITTNAIF